MATRNLEQMQDMDHYEKLVEMIERYGEHGATGAQPIGSFYWGKRITELMKQQEKQKSEESCFRGFPAEKLPEESEITARKKWSDGTTTLICKGGQVIHAR